MTVLTSLTLVTSNPPPSHPVELGRQLCLYLLVPPLNRSPLGGWYSTISGSKLKTT